MRPTDRSSGDAPFHVGAIVSIKPVAIEAVGDTDEELAFADGEFSVPRDPHPVSRFANCLSEVLFERGQNPWRIGLQGVVPPAQILLPNAWSPPPAGMG